MEAQSSVYLVSKCPEIGHYTHNECQSEAPSGANAVLNPQRRDDPEFDVSPLGDRAPDRSPGNPLAHVPHPPLDSDWANRLARTRPELSAASPLRPWQRGVGQGLILALALGTFYWPHATLTVALAALSPVFLSVIALRGLALWHLVSHGQQRSDTDALRLADEEAPLYTVLVPLYRESEVVPDLLAALEKLDYPNDRLEIIFAVEAGDTPTWQALKREGLAAHMHIALVPAGLPRTKPRALMYALQFAAGAYVVVYDAEDEPEPGQLRQALARFASSTVRLGCVQARLNVYNPNDGWLTRQFTLEYTALFDALLPALERLSLPVPLGGTSNHFPRAVLDSVGGWDPYNVTEDADLGIRLARAGWRVEILDSTTWEEAPACFDVWFGQRVRWLKGWMQTYLVHTRNPGQLKRDLGTARFMGLQILMGGLILSALIHPWVYVVAAVDLWQGGHLLEAPKAGVARVFWWLGMTNLVVAYVTAMALAAVAVARRSRAGLAFHAVLVPVYWLLISVAAYRALVQLVTAPYWWQKTVHTARRAASGGR